MYFKIKTIIRVYNIICVIFYYIQYVFSKTKQNNLCKYLCLRTINNSIIKLPNN